MPKEGEDNPRGTRKVKLLGSRDVPVIKRPTDNLEAYSLYLKGRHYMLQGKSSAFEKGLVCLRQALAIEPSFAEAHALISMIYTSQAFFGLAAPHAVIPAAAEAARKAVAIDGSKTMSGQETSCQR